MREKVTNCKFRRVTIERVMLYFTPNTNLIDKIKYVMYVKIFNTITNQCASQIIPRIMIETDQLRVLIGNLCFLPSPSSLYRSIQFFTLLLCTCFLNFHLSFLSSRCPFHSFLLPLDNVTQYLPFFFDTVTLNSTPSYCEYPDDLSHGTPLQENERVVSLSNSQDE